MDEALSAYDESGTLTGDGLVKEGKKYLGEDYMEKKEILGKEKMLTFRMERSVGDKADMIAQTKPKDTKGMCLLAIYCS